MKAIAELCYRRRRYVLAGWVLGLGRLYGESAGSHRTLTLILAIANVAVASAATTVNNVAPEVSLAGDATGVRGQLRSFHGSFSDVGTRDTWTAVVSYGDGTGDQPLAQAGSGPVPRQRVVDGPRARGALGRPRRGVRSGAGMAAAGVDAAAA